MCSHVEMSGSRTEPFPQESSTRQDVWVKDKALLPQESSSFKTVYTIIYLYRIQEQACNNITSLFFNSVGTC